MNKEELAETFLMDIVDSIKSLIKEAFYKGYVRCILSDRYETL